MGTVVFIHSQCNAPHLHTVEALKTGPVQPTESRQTSVNSLARGEMCLVLCVDVGPLQSSLHAWACTHVYTNIPRVHTFTHKARPVSDVKLHLTVIGSEAGRSEGGCSPTA